MNVTMLYKRVVVLLFGVAALTSFASAQTICTADAKLCSDGSYVGRTGPNCEFTACPGGTAVVPPSMPTAPVRCPLVTSNLYLGKKGTEVKELQDFLFNRYAVGAPATGYFGLSTKFYMQKFQRENGLSATGGLGPLSRQKIQNICGGTTPGICTKIYKPVCATPKVNCQCVNGICPPCAQPMPQTYSNECTMRAAGASFVRDGACEDQVVTNEPPASCKVWYDGCNTCSRSSVGGPMACTLMACVMGGTPEQLLANRPTCREYFNTSSVYPVIKSFTGPTTLRAGEKGTWKIDASIASNEALTYDVSWGDQPVYMQALSVRAPEYYPVTQNTTFEHVYQNAGTYTVTITVRAANGNTVKQTSTVVVSPTYSVCYNNGVTYREGDTQSCLYNQTTGAQACIADAVHVCRSGQWKVEGTNWYRYY